MAFTSGQLTDQVEGGATDLPVHKGQGGKFEAPGQVEKGARLPTDTRALGADIARAGQDIVSWAHPQRRSHAVAGLDVEGKGFGAYPVSLDGVHLEKGHRRQPRQRSYCSVRGRVTSNLVAMGSCPKPALARNSHDRFFPPRPTFGRCALHREAKKRSLAVEPFGCRRSGPGQLPAIEVAMTRPDEQRND